LKNIAIRNLTDETHHGLRLRAKANGRSIEAEVREVLTAAALPEGRDLLGQALKGIGFEYDGLDLGLLPKAKKNGPA